MTSLLFKISLSVFHCKTNSMGLDQHQRWVNNDRILIPAWTIPFQAHFCHSNLPPISRLSISTTPQHLLTNTSGSSQQEEHKISLPTDGRVCFVSFRSFLACEDSRYNLHGCHNLSLSNNAVHWLPCEAHTAPQECAGSDPHDPPHRNERENKKERD